MSKNCTYCGALSGVLTENQNEIIHLPNCMISGSEKFSVRPSWPDIYMGFAHSLSKRSTCRRLNVGCVVVSKENERVLAIGYNGNWRGGPNDCDSDEPGQCGCVHAEANAVVKFDPRDSAGATLYSTDSPCLACAKLIINAGIKQVVYDRPYRKTDGIDLLQRANVVIERYQKD